MANSKIKNALIFGLYLNLGLLVFTSITFQSEPISVVSPFEPASKQYANLVQNLNRKLDEQESQLYKNSDSLSQSIKELRQARAELDIASRNYTQSLDQIAGILKESQRDVEFRRKIKQLIDRLNELNRRYQMLEEELRRLNKELEEL